MGLFGRFIVLTVLFVILEADHGNCVSLTTTDTTEENSRLSVVAAIMAEFRDCKQIVNSKHIVLIGETGVGKSTFGNYILGLTPDKGFKTGNGGDSVTITTETKYGRFLGKDENMCISVTDTPGLGDTECRDETHMKSIINTIMDHQKVDMFVLVLRGTDNRFDSGIQRMIQLFQKLLGEKLYKSLLLQFTFFRHDKRSIVLRSLSNITKEKMTENWNHQFKTKLHLKEDLPAVFIDSLYASTIAEDEEQKLQQAELDRFQNYLKTNPKYQCEDHCLEQLNLWYKMMKPNILTESKQLSRNAQVQLKCSIWLESKCPGNFSKSVSLSWKLHANSTDIPIESDHFYELTTVMSDDFPIETSVITFNLTDDTEGEYTCLYGAEFSQHISVTMVLGPKVDGIWTSWSKWSDCTWVNQSRVAHRHRHCIPPQNRGSSCIGVQEEYKPCKFVHKQEAAKCFQSGITWQNATFLKIVSNSENQWDCRKSCIDDEKCQGYTWYSKTASDPAYSLDCKLFSKVGTPVESDGVSGVRECSCSVPFTCQIDGHNPFFFIQRESERECQQLCAETENCNYYTWFDGTSFTSFHCQLYNKCKQGKPCNGCHSGHKTCDNICPKSEEIKVFSASSRNINSFSTDSDCDFVETVTGDKYDWVEINGIYTQVKRDHEYNVFKSSDWNDSGKYKFTGEAGSQMATVAPTPGSCGTNHPGWLNGTNPTIPGTESIGKVCFVGNDGEPCQWSSTVIITNCGAAFVYTLSNTPSCKLKYCGV